MQTTQNTINNHVVILLFGFFCYLCSVNAYYDNSNNINNKYSRLTLSEDISIMITVHTLNSAYDYITMEKKNIGVYLITSKVNGKIYIGSSSDIKKRFNWHKNKLRTNKHHNSHLQRSYDKHGIDNFEFTVLEYCDINCIIEREQYYIDSMNPDYNILKKAYSPLGVKRSEETKRRISNAKKLFDCSGDTKDKLCVINTGKVMSEESKRRLSESIKGRSISEETRIKYRIRMSGEGNPMLGKHHSEEYKAKMSERMSGENNPIYGKPRSDETKKRISEALKGKYCGENHPLYGRKLSQEQKDHLRDINLGKTISEETRAKMSAANKGRIVSQEARDKIAKANIGRVVTEEVRKKISETKKRNNKLKREALNNEQL